MSIPKHNPRQSNMPDQSLRVKLTDAWGNTMGDFVIEPDEYRSEEPIDIAEVVHLICVAEYKDEGIVRRLSYVQPEAQSK